MYGQTNNKRDFGEMSMGGPNTMLAQQQPQQPPFMQQGQGGQNTPSGGATGTNGGYFFPPQQQQQMGTNDSPQMNGNQQQLQLPMGFNPQHMGMPQMPMGGFDPRAMQFMAQQFYSGMNGPGGDPTQMAAVKTDADWALEKRRARNRVTAAESRRKSKEEIQSLREELIRLKDERQEKEDMIEYYRNRYEKYEPTQSSNQPKSEATTSGNVVVAEVAPVSTPAPVVSQLRPVAEATEQKVSSEEVATEESTEQVTAELVPVAPTNV